MTAFLPFMIAFLIGFIVSKKWIKLEFSLALLLLRISIGIGIGIGVISLFTFISLFVPGMNVDFLISKMFNRIFLVTLAILITILLTREIRKIIRTTGIHRPSLNLIILTILFLVGLVFVLDRFLMMSSANSHGGWDAWAIWNLHARFIYFSGDYWRNMFSDVLVWSHVDYPLMTPAMIVFGWKILGNDSRLIPMILGGVFTFGTISVLFSTLLFLRNFRIAILATMILAFSLPFISEGALQYADVPLSYYYLCIISLTIIADEQPENRQKLYVLIGFLLGFTAWTKNEGIVFIISYFLVIGLFNIFRKTFDRQKWLDLAKGLIPVIIVILIFKSLTIGNDIIRSVNIPNVVLLLGDFDRQLLIIKNTFHYLYDFSNGNISILAILLIIVLITGIDKQRFRHEGFPVVIIILVTFFIYLFIYSISPKEISWHMQTSFSRLLIQLYPSLLFVIFNLIADPFHIKGMRK